MKNSANWFRIRQWLRWKPNVVVVRGRGFRYVAEQDPDDGWWLAFVPALPGCGTQAETHEALRDMVRDAIECWLSVDDKKEG